MRRLVHRPLALHRASARRVQKRAFAMAVVAFCALGWAGLTQRAVATTPENIEDVDAGLKPPQLWREIPAEQLAAIGYFRKGNCSQCHVLGKSGAGPDLALLPSSKTPEWLTSHFNQPAVGLASNSYNSQQLKGLIALVSRRDAKGLDAWSHAPEDAIAGAQAFQTRQCGACHTVNGTGGSIAPALNGLFARRSKAWIVGHFTDPRKFVSNSTMPAFQLPPPELAVVTNYILSIPR